MKASCQLPSIGIQSAHLVLSLTVQKGKGRLLYKFVGRSLLLKMELQSQVTVATKTMKDLISVN